MSKEKKYFCPICQKYDTKTVREIVKNVSIEEIKRLNLPFDTKNICFVCFECGNEFDIFQLRKIAHFLNQISIVISIGDILVNIIVFKNNFKMVGNKTYQNAVETVMISWEEIHYTHFQILVFS